MNAWNYGRKVEAKWKPFLDSYYSENYSAWKDVDNVDLQRNLDIDRIVKDKFGNIYTTEDKYVTEYCTYDQLFILIIMKQLNIKYLHIQSVIKQHLFQCFRKIFLIIFRKIFL